MDTYGFKHVNLNPGLMLHYLCTELTHHFLVQAGVYEEHQKKWTAFMRQNGKSPMKAVRFYNRHIICTALIGKLCDSRQSPTQTGLDSHKRRPKA